MSLPTFDPSRLIPGTPGKLADVYVAPAATQPGEAAGPADPAAAAYRSKATEAAVKFESFFISHMLHQMRSGVRAIADEDSASNNKINQDMLDMADNLVADQMAGRRAFGVADAILRQLLPPAAGTNPAPTSSFAQATAHNPVPTATQTATQAAATDKKIISEAQISSGTLNPRR
jgi:flagellar protein FlgJ